MARPSKTNELAPRLIDEHRRIILPAPVMKALGAKSGDHLTFDIKGSEVRLVRVKWVPADK
jgi:bifunctional DNA-binding transcriptional regulator/antitoxin component of YhaV-PrlF toxin-antitoxin module